MNDESVKSWLEGDGAVLRLRLARPKANIVDRAMMAVLAHALDAHSQDRALKVVLLDHEGPHFSFGASIQEHMPDQLMSMLVDFHTLLRRILEYPVPVVVAIRGQCLGGGLELASTGSLIFAAEDAWFGQPEIKIGGFAPAASCILPARLGQAQAEELLLSGRSAGADEALRLGLTQDVSSDPEAAALTWIGIHLLPKSALAVRLATRASRQEFSRRVIEGFRAVETLCAEILVPSHDMSEGLKAFFEKREPVWKNC